MAEAGSLGGGISSDFLGSVVALTPCGLELLRFRDNVILLRKDELGKPLLSGSEGVEIWLTVSAFEIADDWV